MPALLFGLGGGIESTLRIDPVDTAGQEYFDLLAGTDSLGHGNIANRAANTKDSVGKPARNPLGPLQ